MTTTALTYHFLALEERLDALFRTGVMPPKPENPYSKTEEITNEEIDAR